MPRTPLLIVEDAVINSLLQNAAITNEFPFLRTAADQMSANPQRRGCGKCQKRKNRANAVDYAMIKAGIGSLPKSRKARLKEILQADKIRVYFTNSQNQRVKLTF
jgi:hypothetical protein